MSGFITYIEYVAGTNKGDTTQGDLFNSPFALGNVDRNYTSDKVVESYVAASTAANTTLAWTPLVAGTFTKADGTTLGDVKFVKDTTVLYGTFATAAAREAGLIGDGSTLTWVNGEGTSQSAPTLTGGKIAYAYDNVIIPQNDLPILNARLQNIALFAKARRIAVYYSQIAAYQAKTDYGFDLGDQLAEKAVGQLQYEIDTEVTQLLIDNASDTTDLIPAGSLTWSKTLPIGVSKRDHYIGFLEMVELAKQEVYLRTKRFVPNYMLCASDILPVLSFIDAWKPAPTGNINGPYFAGTLGSLKVFVTPNIPSGQYVVGVNGNDMMSSAAVYAPYMPVVPTQLLQFADGATSQGFSTLYDLKMLNARLLVKGYIVA